MAPIPQAQVREHAYIMPNSNIPTLVNFFPPQSEHVYSSEHLLVTNWMTPIPTECHTINSLPLPWSTILSSAPPS